MLTAKPLIVVVLVPGRQTTPHSGYARHQPSTSATVASPPPQLSSSAMFSTSSSGKTRSPLPTLLSRSPDVTLRSSDGHSQQQDVPVRHASLILNLVVYTYIYVFAKLLELTNWLNILKYSINQLLFKSLTAVLNRFKANITGNLSKITCSKSNVSPKF